MRASTLSMFRGYINQAHDMLRAQLGEYAAVTSDSIVTLALAMIAVDAELDELDEKEPS